MRRFGRFQALGAQGQAASLQPSPTPPRIPGAFLLVFQLWMAVTASGSAEQIAVSSLIAYDVYR